MLITIDIKNESKIDSFLNFIKTLDYIDIKSEKKESKKIKKESLENFLGMWKNRDITLDGLREKAWKR